MINKDVHIFGELLTILRKQRRVSQNDLAVRLDMHRNTISNWERGICLPESKTLVLELAKQLHLNKNEAQQLLEASLTAVSPCWLMPYQRNPFFTGRESVLQQLHNTLAHERSAILSQSYALSGLGGIGKTQTAIEYAYRYATEYAAVFWISAETNESITASFVAIADLLDLPEKQEKEPRRVINAVTYWLTSHSDWLVIFDNVEDLELVKGVLPPARCGSLLFTSRRQALGFVAQTLDVEQMTPEEGIRFLLHRARLLDSEVPLTSLTPEVVALAREVVAAMDGLPLALDQAGAYIEATRCGLADYLRLFQSAQLHLLDVRDASSDHPLSVTRTFALAFEQLEYDNPAAAELLTVSAFLAPEAIPESFFIEGAAYLGKTFEVLAAHPFEFQSTIKALLAYSLIQRNAGSRVVTIHRLVQVVLKGRLSEIEQSIWTRRVLRAVDQLFLRDKHQADYWRICEQLLPHALVCVSASEPWDECEVLHVALISHVATYFFNRALYTQAEQLYLRALRIGEKVPASEPLIQAEVFNGLANLYREQGKYEEAEAYFLRTLDIRERVLGSEHLLVSEVLTGLANFYQVQGRYAQVEPLYQRALRIREKELGAQHPQVASSLYNLAEYYRGQGKYEEAERLYQRALSIGKQMLGPEHLEVGYSINGLAMLYYEQGKYEEAEPLFRQALSIWEQALGPEHPNVAYPLVNLGELCKELGKYEEAKPFYQRALRIWEQALGSNHVLIAHVLYGLGECCREQGKYEEAELLYQRALMIREQALGPEHPEVAEPIQGIAILYAEQGKYEEAEPLFQRALTIRQQRLGPQHSYVAETLYHFAHFHQLRQQMTEALSLYQQALTIREQALGFHHLKTDATRTAYVHLLRDLGRVEEAAVVELQV